MKVLKPLLVVLAACLTGLTCLLILAMVTDYRPADEEIISQTDSAVCLQDTMVLSFLTWNIGYGGLDRDMDFFYEGGEKVFTPEEQFISNMEGIGSFLKSNDSLDFMLLQEVDRKSRRSYGMDELNYFSGNLVSHHAFFAKNYDVPFVPSPLSRPMGKVTSGIVTFSKYLPFISLRCKLPGNLGFPTSLFYLDRCFLVSRYKMAGGRELVIINTHMEAYDSGNVRKKQMERLSEFMMEEYASGNYVVAGGDWNQSPPGFKAAFATDRLNMSQMEMQPDVMADGWQWVFDPSVPSNRSVQTSYVQGITPVAVIDYFLLSPNLRVASVRCLQLGFRHADHNPVILTLCLP